MCARLRLVWILGLCTAGFSAVYAVSPEIENFLTDEDHNVTEDGLLPFRPETADFVRAVTSDWKLTLEQLSSIAPDTRRQSLVIVAGEYLRPKDYVAFVDSLCELRSEGVLTPEALRHALWAKLMKDGFLAFNYDQPEVISVVLKLEALITRDFPDRWSEYFGELKSGKMKARIIERDERDGENQPELYAAADNPVDQQFIRDNLRPDMKARTTGRTADGTSLINLNRSWWNLILMVAVLLLAIAGFVVLRARLGRS